jgi:iron complex outermembrane receptor protein
LENQSGFLPGGSVNLGGWDASDNFTDLSPKFGLGYHFTPELETYASVSRGYQSGGFNAANDIEGDASFAPSHSWHYEVGAKSKWFENKFLVNGALFYTDSHNYQVYRINSIDPSQAYIANADRVQSYGAELDMTARPCTNLDLSAAFGVTEAKFDRFKHSTTIQTQGGPITTTTKLNGKDVNFVPQFTANLAAQYRFPFNIYARVEYEAIGQYYLDEANSAKQAAYGLFNARIGYQAEHFEIYLFGKNLFDKHFVNNALDLRNSQPGFADQLIRQPGDPRILGVALSANF